MVANPISRDRWFIDCISNSHATSNDHEQSWISNEHLINQSNLVDLFKKLVNDAAVHLQSEYKYNKYIGG